MTETKGQEYRTAALALFIVRNAKLRRQSWRFTLWFMVLALGLLFFQPGFSLAGAPVHGTKAASMGTAFVAIADDPSAISHNPAGLTKLKGTNVYAGATAVIPSTKYNSPSAGSEDTEFQVFFPPHLYVSSDFGMENLVLGLGIYSPFGIGGRKWDDHGLTRYASVESMIATVSVNPTVAWRVLPCLSIGFGVDYMHSFNEAKKKLDQSSVGAGDANLSLDADGGGWGYNIGLLAFPDGKLSVGIAYRSGIDNDQSGEITLENIAPALQPVFGGSRFKTKIDSTVEFPELVSFGIAFRPTTKLTFELGAEWAGWSSFDEQVLDLRDEVPEAGLSDILIPCDWEDAWLLRLGTDYKVNDRFSLRGGYVFVENSVPDHTLSPATPEADQHNFIIGFGYQMNKAVVDFFYMAAFFNDRKVENDILSGEYENFVHYIGLSWGYKF